MATIGVTDSGMGGLTVLNALIRNCSHNYIFLADTPGAPYGLKSKENITFLTGNCIDRLICAGADIIVVACNTATSAAIDTIRSIYDIDIIGTEPAIMPAIRAKHKKILSLATPYTIQSARYIRLAANFRDYITDCPCRDLAALIEAAAPDFDKLYDYIKSILKPFLDYTAIVIGCTHYALVADIIKKIMPHAEIFDSSAGIVSRVKHICSGKGLAEEDLCVKITGIREDLETSLYYEVLNNLR